MKKNYTNEILLLDDYLKNNLSSKRYKHSKSVAEMAFLLAKKFDLDVIKSYLAGLSHDIAREFSKEETEKYLTKINGLSNDFFEVDILYHGPVGAIFLEERFNIKDNDILSAVKYHSIGNAVLSDISKIIYIADYISMDRTHIDNNFRKEILKLDLNSMIYFISSKIISYLKVCNRNILPETNNMYLEAKEVYEKKKRV